MCQFDLDRMGSNVGMTVEVANHHSCNKQCNSVHVHNKSEPAVRDGPEGATVTWNGGVSEDAFVVRFCRPLRNAYKECSSDATTLCPTMVLV